MRKHQYWWLLLVLLVLAVVYVLSQKKQSVAVQQPFFGIDSVMVAKIDMKLGKNQVILVKGEDGWKMTYPGQDNVNQEVLQDFFRNVLPVTNSSIPISENKDTQKDYYVSDDTGVELRMFGTDGKELSHCFIGFGVNSNFCYARRANEKKIYQLNQNIRNQIEPSPDMWRNMSLLSCNIQDIVSIDVTFGNKEYKLTQSDNGTWIYTDAKTTFAINYYNRAIVKVLNVLKETKTIQIIDTTKPDTTDVQPVQDVFSLQIHMKNKQAITVDTYTTKSGTFYSYKNGDKRKLYAVYTDFINRFTIGADHYLSVNKM